MNNIIRLFTLRTFIVLLFALIMFVSVSSVQAATLSLSPSKSSVKVGDEFTVDILLDTSEVDTDGVDIKYLNFDPEILEVQKIEAGTLYPVTQINKFDNTNGTINFAQITAGGSFYNGSGVLVTVTFLAKVKSRKTSISFDFELDDTTDTNVASVGVDVLTNADGGNYRLLSGRGFFSWIVEFFHNIFSRSD